MIKQCDTSGTRQHSRDYELNDSKCFHGVLMPN
jgi:hypothetical protein